MTTARRGLFVVIEGADGVGSTTQCRALVQQWQQAGLQAALTAEPSKGPIGRLIREMLGGDRPRLSIHRELALLFAADRLDHVAREVAPLQDTGTHVVSDRYVLSSLVYQSLDLPLSWVESLNAHAPVPDATLLVTLPVDEAARRMRARGGKVEVFDDLATQRRVHARYEELAAHVGAVLIDGEGPIDVVTERCVQALRARGVWPT